jgi:hypothetical protein
VRGAHYEPNRQTLELNCQSEDVKSDAKMTAAPSCCSPLPDGYGL